MISDLRDDLRAARSLLAAGETVAAAQKLDDALQGLEGSRLLTTTDAAEMLDIRSVNTLKALVRVEGIRTSMHGNRMMIPLSEVERLKDSARLGGIQAADRAHEATEVLGSANGLTQDEMDALAESRPGAPPWKRLQPNASDRHPA